MRVLTFCVLRNEPYGSIWVIDHGYYIIHLASVCKIVFRGWTWVRWWGPNGLSSLGLGGKDAPVCVYPWRPVLIPLGWNTLAKLGDPDSVTWWLHLVRVVWQMPIVWTVLLCTPRRPRDLFTEIGTTLHIGWVLEYYLSYACDLLLIYKMIALLWLDCDVMWSELLNIYDYSLCCVAPRGPTGRWCRTYYLAL